MHDVKKNVIENIFSSLAVEDSAKISKFYKGYNLFSQLIFFHAKT